MNLKRRINSHMQFVANQKKTSLISRTENAFANQIKYNLKQNQCFSRVPILQFYLSYIC